MPKGEYLGQYSPTKGRLADVFWHEGEQYPAEIRIFRTSDKALLLTIWRPGYPTGIEEVDGILGRQGKVEG